MDESFFLRQISQQSSISIMSGLVGLSDFLGKGGMKMEFVNSLFQLLIPLLNHNHYKVRLLAFALTEHLFESYFAVLSNTALALPLLIFSLSSVNKSIAASAYKCLGIMFEALDTSVWWPDVENGITAGKGNTTKLQLLKLVRRVPNRIPLNAVVALLNDPVANIRTAVEEILFAADIDKARAALEGTVLSFDAHMKFGNTILAHDTTVGNESDRHAPAAIEDLAPRAKLEIVQEAPSARRAVEKLKKLAIGPDSSYCIDGESQLFRTDMRVVAEFEPVTVRVEVMSADESEPMSVRDISDGFGSVRDPADCPIPGHIIKRTVSAPLGLRDMTNMSWLERVTFFEMLLDVLERGSSLSQSGGAIIKCILTGAFPLHKKATPLLADALGRLALIYPEALEANLHKVTEFLLHATRPPSMLTVENGKALLNVVLSEAPPDKLITVALSIVSGTGRPLSVEPLMLLVYQHHPETLLPRVTLRNLLGFLLHNRNKSDVRDKLLSILCQKETEEVIKFYHTQQRDVKQVLRPMLPVKIAKERVEKTSVKTRKRSDNMKKHSQNDLKLIVDKEMKNGMKCDFVALSSALLSLTIEDIDALIVVFKKFLCFLASLDEAYISANRFALDDICANVFAATKLFVVLDARFVLPKIISGLSVFVWHCPVSMLNTSTSYYPRLYELFKEATSEHREAIVRIVIAIENVTGKSFLTTRGITSIHRTAITNLLSQLQVEDI